jgi:hypothetical protein
VAFGVLKFRLVPYSIIWGIYLQSTADV